MLILPIIIVILIVVLILISAVIGFRCILWVVLVIPICFAPFLLLFLVIFWIFGIILSLATIDVLWTGFFTARSSSKGNLWT